MLDSRFTARFDGSRPLVYDSKATKNIRRSVQADFSF
jgi:hypothetical protein